MNQIKTTNYGQIIYSTNNTPWYFGAYLNMARHNIFLLINHLTTKFSYIKDYKKLPDRNQNDKTRTFAATANPFSLLKDDEHIIRENILTKIFDTSYPQYENDRFRVYKYLLRKHYLPFIKVFRENEELSLDDHPIVDYNGLNNFINESFKQIVRLRNAFSHYSAVDKNGIKISNRTLEVSLSIYNQVNILFNNSSKYSLERFLFTQSDKDFEHLSLYKIFEDKGSIFTEQGLYFFINLFLERSYGIKFLKKIRGFKNDTNPAFRATIKTFTTYALKTSDERLDNDDPTMSLLMDVLNELQRCPDIIYKHLSEEDKEKFLPKLEDAAKMNVLLNSVNYEEIQDEQIDRMLNGITTLKRHQDRFPYFALRCIDELNLLPNIRFQITLGHIEKRAYDKQVGKVILDRRILKKLNAFGKLSDFEGKEEQVTNKLNHKIKAEALIFDQFNPHYNINNNKIGFFVFKNSQEKVFWPKIIDFESKTSLQQKRDNEKPTGFLSVHDLPKLLLLALQSPNSAEKDIIKFIDNSKQIVLNESKLQSLRDQLELSPVSFNRRQVNVNKLKTSDRVNYLNNNQIEKLRKQNRLKDEMLSDLSLMKTLITKTSNERNKEYLKQLSYVQVLKVRKNSLQQILPEGLKVNQLPTKVVDYLLGLIAVDPLQKTTQRLKEIQLDTKSRLRLLKKDNYVLKAGEIATFIAKDLINLVIDKDFKQKITSVYYIRLQHQLAYFSSSKDELFTILQELNIFDYRAGHPFLTKYMLTVVNNIQEFYEYYLKERQNWIITILKRRNLKDELKNNNIKLPYIIKAIVEKSQKTDFESWIKAKKSLPIDLPNTVFDESLEFILKNKLNEMQTPYLETDKFSVLFGKVLMNDKQPFYNYTRWYHTKDGDVPFSAMDGHSSLLVRNEFSRYAEIIEKKIRYVLTQDRVLRLACQDILKQIGNTTEQLNIKLSDIYPFSLSNPLNKSAHFSQKIKISEQDYIYIVAADSMGQKEEVVAFNNLDTEVERNQFKGQKGYQWTIKDFGRFKRFVHDRRLPNIFKYLDNNTTSYDFLSYQLFEYDQNREKIFKLTFELEELLANNYWKELVEKKLACKFEFPEIEFKLYLQLIENKKLLSPNEISFLKNIRNKFSHSQFPTHQQDMSNISNDDIKKFEDNKRKKGYRDETNLSISKRIYEKYNLIVKIVERRVKQSILD